METHRIAAKTGGDQDEIMEDFGQIKQKDMDKDGKLKIVGKDQIREALGRSPDAGDTFLMRMETTPPSIPTNSATAPSHRCRS